MKTNKSYLKRIKGLKKKKKVSSLLTQTTGRCHLRGQKNSRRIQKLKGSHVLNMSKKAISRFLPGIKVG